MKDKIENKMSSKEIQIYEKIKNTNTCMDQVRTLNQISGNPLSDIELGQLCKDLQNIVNNNVERKVQDISTRPPSSRTIDEKQKLIDSIKRKQNRN
tara:strand:+ start:50 stop:337 length:288 start_codon:yes stop_codon:yes gene_type:complete